MNKYSDKIKNQIIESYSEDKSQEKYILKAKNGLWDSEKEVIRKFCKNKGKFLDIGCGTGRTTFALYHHGYDVIGIDLVPKMIENAKNLINKDKKNITFLAGDAINLKFKENTFDNVLFSNLGWSQIPTDEERFKAIKEAYRVLKNNGIFILVTPRRKLLSSFILFWIIQAIKIHLLKPLGFHIKERKFGDRFYNRETNDKFRIYNKEQYVYIPNVSEVSRQLKDAGFKILEIYKNLQISNKDIREIPPVFFVAKKP